MPSAPRRHAVIRAAALVSANLLVLLFLLVLVEGGARLVNFFASCRSDCSADHLKNPPSINPPAVGFLRFDPLLGFEPEPGFDMTLSEDLFPEWQGSKVTILPNGNRANDGDIALSADGSIVAVGDSFTFGYGVANHETWPACLERLGERIVHNAGVPGYGAAQSLRRLENLIDQNGGEKPPVAIMSIVVGEDFDRDRMRYFLGSPRPAVVGDSLATVKFDAVSDPSIYGSLFGSHSPRWHESVAAFMANQSWLAKYLVRQTKYLERYEHALSEVHDNAAPKDLLIEWTINRFADIPIRKVLVLQYWKFAWEEALVERDLILQWAHNRNLTVVDTYDALREHNSVETLYRPGRWGHHSPLGNSLVCEEILRKAGHMLRP